MRQKISFCCQDTRTQEPNTKTEIIMSREDSFSVAPRHKREKEGADDFIGVA